MAAPSRLPPRERILVVEDDANMRRTLQLLLNSDWDVDAVADGRSALAAAALRVPDLVLSDLVLPGLDGFALLHRLRADPRTRLVPIIAVSGLDQEEARIHALESGASDFLIKPFSERELRARVATQLEMARLRREALQRQSEERFRSLVEAIRDYAICRLDTEGRIVSWNAGAEAIHGYREQEILGRPFSIFHSEEADWSLEATLRGRKEESFQLNGFTADRVQNALTVYYEDVISSLADALRANPAGVSFQMSFRHVVRLPESFRGGCSFGAGAGRSLPT